MLPPCPRVHPGGSPWPTGTEGGERLVRPVEEVIDQVDTCLVRGADDQSDADHDSERDDAMIHSVRMTVTLDPDVESLIEAAVRERSISFKQAVNDAIRAGLAPRSAA